MWEEDFEIEPLVEGGATRLPQAPHAGVRGLDGLPVPPDPGAHAGGRPRADHRGLALDGVDVEVMHPNLSLFGLYSDDHELSMAHARVYNDYVIERFTPYFDRLAPTAPVPLTDIGEAVAEIERVAAAGFRAILLPAIAADALLVAGPRPRVGRRPGQRRAGVHPHPDRRREGQRPGVHDAQGRHGVRRAGQPADDREVGLEADGHPVDLQHDRPPAGHLRAHRRRRPRALPRPPLRPDRVQRPLAGVAGRGHGQVLDHRHRPGRRLVARPLGRRPARRRPAPHGAAVPPEREVALPADAERVRAAPVPRLVPGRSRGRRLPAHHRGVDASCGATTTRTPKGRSAAAGS